MVGSAFSRLADVLPQPVLLFTSAGVLEEANRAALVAFPKAAIGQTFATLFVDVDGRARTFLRDCGRVRKAIPASFTDTHGRAWRMHGALYRPATSTEPALLVIRIEEEDAASIRFLALNRQLENLRSEMRSRRQAELELRREREWLRVTLMSIGDAVIATDVEGRVVFMNPIAQSLTGWSTGDAVGVPVTQVFRIINEGTRQSVEDPVAKVLRDGHAVGLANHTILIARDGSEWPIDDSAAPIRDEDGVLSGVVLVFHQIVERRKLDQLQRQRIEELERESRLKDEFLAMLAHELRNPLAPLLTAATLLGDAPDPALVARVSAVVDRQVRHLSRLVDDLLDVSRITRGKIDLRRERVDINSVITAAVETVQPQVEKRQHTLQTDLASDLPPIDADPVRIEQILTNLLTNAVKYTPPGGQIQLAASCTAEGVLVAVRDSGVGVSAELLPRVFDPFVQGDRSLDRSEGGLGIGLTLVKHLVELHGGTCSIHSDGRGRGCELQVRLPAAPGSLPRSPARPSARAAGLRILVVDDQRDAADLLAQLLNVQGHVASVAYDGPSGLQRALIEHPDVALLDIGLPGMDGFELARRIRRAPGLADCMLVAITGYGQETDRRRSAESGFAAHLLKPIDPATLQDLLASLPRRH